MARELRDLIIVLAAIAVEAFRPSEACFGGKGGGGGIDQFYQDDEPSTRFVREQRKRERERLYIVQHSFEEGRAHAMPIAAAPQSLICFRIMRRPNVLRGLLRLDGRGKLRGTQLSLH